MKSRYVLVMMTVVKRSGIKNEVDRKREGIITNRHFDKVCV
jgi:hypothetical protein